MGTDRLPQAPTGDIETQDDVEELVRRFYGDVAQDDILGPLFNDIARVDWSAHLPKLTLFWCRAIFGTEGYAGNPYRKHAQVHAQQAFTAEHFHRWLDLFHETIDLGWVGVRAEGVKELARNVAHVHSGQLLGDAVDVSEYADRGPIGRA